MKIQTKATARLFGFATTALLLLFVLACIDRPMQRAPLGNITFSLESLPQSTERDVDLLFIIDNSGSMADEQILLQQAFPALMQEIGRLKGGLPNLHLGVVTTDLGTGMFDIGRCSLGGDGGRLHVGNCANPQGAKFIVDVEPKDCDITKDASGTPVICSAHACDAQHCAHEPSTNFVVDANGCPRCRNYTGESLEDAFSCIANVGTMGCGFEQQLEAMKLALDPATPENVNFVRENAFLGLVFITDEDDCSAANPQIFDDTQTDINSTLGPLTSFRCFEFGVWCDINERTHQGLRQDCIPRDDPGALLHTISRYVQSLTALKDPQTLVISAISGPVTPSPSGGGGNVSVGLDGFSQPELQYSCTSSFGSTPGGAVPAIRLQSFIEQFNNEVDMSWAYTSICSQSFTSALEGIGLKIRGALDPQCLPSPPKNCADPGKEYGLGDSCDSNDQCLADCSVQDVFGRGTDDETRSQVPPCLEVCDADGNGTYEVCPGNTDRSIAYMLGHPLVRDPALPVSACWHINYNESCEQSNAAEILVARREDPPPRSFALVGCSLIEKNESLCNDQIDNDEDCLIDTEDPDCF